MLHIFLLTTYCNIYLSPDYFHNNPSPRFKTNANGAVLQTVLLGPPLVVGILLRQSTRLFLM